MIAALSGSGQEVQASAAAALRHLAVNSQNHEVIREKGGVQALVKVVHEGGQEGRKESAAALQNLGHPGAEMAELLRGRWNLALSVASVGGMCVAFVTSCGLGRETARRFLTPLLEP